MDVDVDECEGERCVGCALLLLLCVVCSTGKSVHQHNKMVKHTSIERERKSERESNI